MQTTSSTMMSKAAKKRVIALVILVAAIALIVSLVSDSLIVGNWKLENPNVASTEITKYFFDDNGTGTIRYQASENTPAHLVKFFAYSYEDNKLVINLDGEKEIYDTSRFLNNINLNDQKSLSYDDSFSPMLRIVILVLLAFAFIWAVEDDFNALTRAAAAKRKETGSLKKRIIAGVLFLVFIVVFVLTTLPSLRLSGEWKASDSSAVYTFKADGTGVCARNDVEGKLLLEEKFTYEFDQKPGLFTTTFAEGPKVYFGLMQGNIKMDFNDKSEEYATSFIFNTLNFKYADSNELDAKGQPTLKTIALENQDSINPTLCIVVAFIALFLSIYFIQDDVEASKRKKAEKKQIKIAQKAKKARSK